MKYSIKRVPHGIPLRNYDDSVLYDINNMKNKLKYWVLDKERQEMFDIRISLLRGFSYDSIVRSISFTIGRMTWE